MSNIKNPLRNSNNPYKESSTIFLVFPLRLMKRGEPHQISTWYSHWILSSAFLYSSVVTYRESVVQSALTSTGSKAIHKQQWWQFIEVRYYNNRHWRGLILFYLFPHTFFKTSSSSHTYFLCDWNISALLFTFFTDAWTCLFLGLAWHCATVILLLDVITAAESVGASAGMAEAVNLPQMLLQGCIDGEGHTAQLALEGRLGTPGTMGLHVASELAALGAGIAA